MRSPKKMLTKRSYDEWFANIITVRQILNKIINEADDLHIGALEGDKSLDVLYAAQELFESDFFLEGDGEK